MTLADAVADEVRRRAAARGLSQNRLARDAGIPPSLIHRALSGGRQLQLDEVERLAPILGVTPLWLLRSACMHVPPSGECSKTNGVAGSD